MTTQVHSRDYESAEDLTNQTNTGALTSALSLSITPESASDEWIVIGNTNIKCSNSGTARGQVVVYDDSTAIAYLAYDVGQKDNTDLASCPILCVVTGNTGYQITTYFAPASWTAPPWVQP